MSTNSIRHLSSLPGKTHSERQKKSFLANCRPNNIWLTFIVDMNKYLIVFFFILVTAGYHFVYAQTIDSFEPFSLVKMNQHVGVVKDSLQHHKKNRVIKGDMYPRKDYADSNLYATVYIHSQEKDPVSIWGTESHVGISFYRNRIFHINYVLLIPNEYMLQGMYNWLVAELGNPSDSAINVIHSSPNDYHELTKPDNKFIWHGDHYDLEFLIEKTLQQYQVELVKVNQTANQKYTDEVRLVEEQKKQLDSKKSRKVKNLNRITLETIEHMIGIVSDYKHYSYLEAILPSYTRTDVIFHKRKHDKDGIYWGYRDMDLKAYYMYDYDIFEKNPIYKKTTCYFKKIVVYCDVDHHIFQIRIDFQRNSLISTIEPYILKTECIQHFDKNNIKGYYDLLQTVIVTLKHNGDEAGSMIISKEFLEYLIDLDK
jgi:hypothetical protein